MATTRLVRIDTAGPIPTSLTLLDGTTDTGYSLLSDTTFGDSIWEHVEAGVRGTLGRTAATGYPVERQARLAVRVAGATKPTADARIAQLDEALDQLRRYGGRICVRENGSAVRVYLDVLRVTSISTASRNDATARRDIAADLVCGPFLLGDPLDTIEAWATDTVSAGEWTPDEGAVTRAGGGNCVLSGQTRLRLTGPGYQPTDAEASLAYTTPGSTTGISAMVCICADPHGADTMLGVELTSAALRVVKREAGAATTLATTAYTPAASTTYWIAIRREGGKLTADVYTARPVVGIDTPAATVSYSMTAAEQAKFVRGHAAIRLNATSAAVAIGEVRVRPYTYVGVQTPTNIALTGAVPGTAPALADLHIAAGAASGSGASGTIAKTYPVYALAGWGVTIPFNRCSILGDIAYAANRALISTAISGMSNSGATLSAGASARYGRNSIQVATAGGTTYQGCGVRVFGEYRKGRVLASIIWAKATSGTPGVATRLGEAASFSTSPTATLSTAAWTLISNVYQPATDVNAVYFGAFIPATTAGTFLIDGGIVWECDPAALSASMLAGTSGARETITVTATPDSIVAPCLALIDSELVQVESISGTTWTVIRGREGTTNATHSSGAIVYALPPLRDHVEGDGAPAPIGVIHAANRILSTDIVTDADYASGFGVVSSGGTNLAWVAVDPGALAGDPYTDTVDIDVYARLDILTAPATTLPLFGAFPLAASSFAQVQPGNPSSKRLVLPTGAKSERFVYIGALTLPRTPAAWGIYLTTDQVGTGVDYFLLVPRRASVRGAEGKTLTSSYPEQFMSDTNWRARVWEADGAGYIVPPGKPDARYPYHGIGGSTLELDPGPNTLVVKLCNHVPDDPTAGDGADYERVAASVHLAVTPRYLTVRDA